MTGFLEESPGVKSMTRLCAALLVSAVLLLAIALAVYLLTADTPNAGVITAFAAPMVPLAGGVWGALHERTGGADA